MDNYIIINQEALKKRIEELQNIERNSTLKSAARQDVILELKEILSNSIPLQPEIEKAFDAGENLGRINRLGITKQDYISQLKLDT
jgi:hypothetical protein